MWPVTLDCAQAAAEMKENRRYNNIDGFIKTYKCTAQPEPTANKKYTAHAEIQMHDS
jgi:hypothetical protein